MIHSTPHQNNQHTHHQDMIRNFRHRFWSSLILTIPILFLSPMIQQFLGIGDALQFAFDDFLLLALSTIVFLYGGYPFLKGFFDEIISKSVGMMTLISLTIAISYIYSTAVIFGLQADYFIGNWRL